MTEAEPPRSRWTAPPWVWVAIVLLIGVLAGILIAWSLPTLAPRPPPGGAPCGGSSNPCATARDFNPVAQAGVVLEVVTFVLLVALLVVYIRIYRRTRTRHALALTVFLGALVLEPALGSPFIFLRFAGSLGLIDLLYLAGRFFMCVALSVFLYISLE